MHKKVGLMLALIGLVVVGTSVPALATKPPQHLVTICHATPPDTAAQGWVQITVDVASVGYKHSGHESEHDADIIPPYSYDDFSYPGKNWSEEGQAIWRNGCEVPGTTTTTTQPPVTTTTEGTTTSAPTTTVPIPPTTHVPSTTAPLAPPTTAPPVAPAPRTPHAVTPPVLAHTGSGTWVVFWTGFGLLMLGLGIWAEQKWSRRKSWPSSGF